ncbi:hypothetical protein KZP23_03670 [Echinicola marina]|uniref:hypothetical protein n=1 Tax=Echinicola marina TaxID=2859768 RepID=UPI001CF6A24F|nr:hypothetical protein [Echinicola marina]UCS94142.1 hypothetical protein KZP23_03670 [Echinicola marina]
MKQLFMSMPHFKELGVLMIALLFSCNQIETFEIQQESDEVFSVMAGDNLGNCESDCIDLSAEDVRYYPISGTQSQSTGNGGGNPNKASANENGNTNTKEVSFSAYNTENEFIVAVTYNITEGNSKAKATITINIAGDEVELDEVASGSTVMHSIALPDGWEACDVIDFSIIQEGLGSIITFNESYNLIGVCPDECEIRTASAYAGNKEGENNGEPSKGFNNAWWYVFDIEAGTQDVFANQDEVIGTVSYDELEGTITIDLGDWSLQEGEESVKWYSYAEGELPDAGRPIPGQAPNKSNSLVIDTVEGGRYYAIHLDVEICE